MSIKHFVDLLQSVFKSLVQVAMALHGIVLIARKHENNILPMNFDTSVLGLSEFSMAVKSTGRGNGAIFQQRKEAKTAK